MMNRKGQLELSANFIVIIIISIIILVGGLALFYRMIHSAQTTVSTLDDQTEQMIKDMMTDSDRTAVYPAEMDLTDGDSILIGIGITNIYNEEVDFTVKLISVVRYANATVAGTTLADESNPGIANYNEIVSTRISILPHDKFVKGMFLKMPKGASPGQYTYTIAIRNSTQTNNYGLVQVIVNNK
jgi:hypothetical protein